MKKIFFLLFLIFPPISFTQDFIDLGKIVVSVQDQPLDNDNYLSQDLISSYPSLSLEEMIDYSSSIDLLKRSRFGLQQDVSIRGGSFEDTKIMLNGIKINDPQTGHYNLELPLTLYDLNQTRISFSKNEVDFSIKDPQKQGGVLTNFFGQHGLFENLLSLNFSLGENILNRISIEHKTSSGSGDDKDFETYTFSLSSLLNRDSGETRLFFGLIDRDFGASNFYSSSYPHEHEDIKQYFFMLNDCYAHDKFVLENNVYFRKHLDEFVLNRHAPDFFKNNTTTYVYGFSPKFKFDDWFIALQFDQNEINSSNLGKHQRFNQGFSLGRERIKAGKFTSSFDLGLTNMQGFDLIETINLDFNYELTDWLNSSFIYNRYFRAPSFTELYYSSPGNVGNSNLDLQRIDNFEVVLNQRISSSLGLNYGMFFKKQDKVIDWGRNSTVDPWVAYNGGNIDVYGADFSLRFNPDNKFVQSIGLDYTYLWFQDKGPYQFSKYIFDYNKHKLVASIGLIIKEVYFDLMAIYSKPTQRGQYLTCDLKLTKDFANYSLFVQGVNIFNKDYYEGVDIEGEGRWFKFGIEYRF